MAQQAWLIPIGLMWSKLTMQVLAVCLRGAGAKPEADGLEDPSALRLPAPAYCMKSSVHV